MSDPVRHSQRDGGKKREEILDDQGPAPEARRIYDPTTGSQTDFFKSSQNGSPFIAEPEDQAISLNGQVINGRLRQPLRARGPSIFPAGTSSGDIAAYNRDRAAFLAAGY